MKITQTRICIDCEEVFPDGTVTCPLCASHATILLAKWVAPISTLTKDMKAVLTANAGIPCCAQSSVSDPKNGL